MLESIFRHASRLRGARVFHPRGVAFHALWRPVPGGPLPAGSPVADAPSAALLRLSHAAGLPPSMPDVLGWAIKLPGVHGPHRDQDLLLASTGRGRLGRHLLRPGRDLARATFSSLLPYSIPGAGKGVIVARAFPGSPAAPYTQVRSHRIGRIPPFEVRFGGSDGPLLATVHAQRPASGWLAEASRYDPWHTGPELEPVGWLNRVRRPTYTASQDGRGAPATIDLPPTVG